MHGEEQRTTPRSENTVRIEVEPDESISLSVVEAVAEYEDVDPLELPPIYDTVDPDALDALFGPADSELPTASFEFEHAGCAVRILATGDGLDVEVAEGTSATAGPVGDAISADSP